MTDARITPTPTDAEAAAIMAAVVAVWPTPSEADDEAGNADTTWRFSGRWWHRAPAPAANRRRPR